MFFSERAGVYTVLLIQVCGVLASHGLCSGIGMSSVVVGCDLVEKVVPAGSDEDVLVHHHRQLEGSTPTRT